MERSKAPSVQALSEQLGLSKSTVSKALNGYTQVSAQTRARVLNAAAEMGYAPAPQSTQRRIGWPFQTTLRSYDNVSMIVRGFQELAPMSNMEVVLIPEFTDAFRAGNRLADVMQQNNLDGLFLSSLRIGDDYLKEVGGISAPVVFWDLPIEMHRLNFGFIAYDSLAGAEMAVSHLVGLGHRRIGFLNGHDKAFVSHQRMDGYRLGLSKAGIPFDENLVHWGDFTLECGPLAAEHLLAQGATAIFCASDQMALGVVRAAQSKGLSVPGDLSVVGYDDDFLAALASPALTTIRQDFIGMGHASYTVMDCLMRSMPIPPVVLRPELVVRGTTDAPNRSSM